MESLFALAPAAFFGGVLSFLSPCVLPLVPGYLCFAAGLQFQDMAQLAEKGKATPHILPGAVAFVAGFASVFIALGASAAAINPLLVAHQQMLAQLAGGLIMLLGLHIAGIVPLPFLARDMRFATSSAPHQRVQQQDNKTTKLLAAFVMGLAFAFGWTPCIGPILASILALAATRESLSEGVVLLAIYAAGLGAPFILAALGVGRFIAISKTLKRHMVWVGRSAGALLILTGALMMAGRLQSIASYLLDWFPFLARLG